MDMLTSEEQNLLQNHGMRLPLDPREPFLMSEHDPVNHPRHYTSHPSGIEAITIAEHFNFCLGNAFKYIFRADLKGNDIEDLEKARWYLDREIENRKAAAQLRTAQRRAGYVDDVPPL